MKKPVLFLSLLGLLLAPACRVDFDAVEDDVREARRGLTTYAWRDDSTNFKISIKGRLELTPDESEVASLEPEGFLKIEETGTSNWTYEAVAAPDGTIRRTFTHDGQPVTGGEDSETWLVLALERLLRQSGLQAPERVARLLEEGGWPAVAGEIEKINSDQVTRLYIEELLSRAEPDVEQARWLGRVAARLQSPSEAERVTAQIADRHPEDAELTAQLVDVVGSIRSDSGRVRLIEVILSTRNVEEDSALKISRFLEDVRSSSDKANGLLSLAESAPSSPTVRLALLEAAATIRSGSDEVRALRGILDGVPLNPELSIRAAEIMGEVRSSTDRAGALRQLVADIPLDAEVLQAVLEASRSLSNSNREQVILALLRRDYRRPQWQSILSFVESTFPAGESTAALQKRITRRMQESP